MTKEEIINELNRLNLDKNEFWILGSASLVLRNIIDQANDIDIAITSKYYNFLTKKYNIEYLGENNNKKWYKLNEIIEFCIDELTPDKVEVLNPYNLLDLNYYYNNFLKDSIREKDELKKKLVEQRINNKQ